MENLKGKNHILQIAFLIFLIIQTIVFVILIYDNYNAATFRYDSALFLNVSDNLRKGNGFVFNVVLSTFDVDETTGKAHSDSNSQKIIEQYPSIITKYGKPPVFFVVEAGFLEIFSANPANWIFYVAVLSVIISILFIILFYIFCKKYFGITIAMLSSLLIGSSTIFILFTSVGRINILAYVFVIASLFFLEKKNKHYFLFGVFCGIANLTHPLGIIPLAAYSIFLLLKREFRGLIIILFTWISIMIPWMLRQYFEFADFGSSLGIPFSKQISSLFMSSSTITSSSTQFAPLIMKPLEMLSVFFNTAYNIEFLSVYLIFLVFYFISIEKIKKTFTKKEWTQLLGLIICLTVFIIIYSYYIESFIPNEKIVHIIEFILIVGYPIIFVVFSKVSKLEIFDESIKRHDIVLIFVVLFFIFGTYGAMLNSLQVNHFVAFPLFFIITPFGIVGIKKIILYVIHNKNERIKKLVPNLSLLVLVILSVSIVIPLSLSFANSYESVQILYSPSPQILHWIKENTNTKEVLMNENPTVLFIGTGNPVVITPVDIGFDYVKFLKYIEYYDVDYYITNLNERSDIAELIGFKKTFQDGDWKILKRDKNFTKCNITPEDIKLLVSSKRYIVTLRTLDICSETASDTLEKIDFKLRKIQAYKEWKRVEEIPSVYDEIYQILEKKLQSSIGIEREKFEEKYYEMLNEELNWSKENSEYNNIIRIYNKIIDYDKFNKNAWYGRAETLEKLGKFQEALRDYNFLLNLVKDNDEEYKIKSKITDIEKMLSNR